MKKLSFALLAIVLFVFCSGCGASNTLVSTESFAMDTLFKQEAYTHDDEVLHQNNRMLAEIEGKMSKTIESSEIYQANHANGAPVEVSEETKYVVSEALAAADQTEGSFNPALGNIMSAWGFRSEEPAVPPADQLAQLLSTTDYHNIQVIGNTISAGNTSIDLGGVVKGYALDRVAENLEREGVDSALVNFGGSLYAVGTKPNGIPFVIGVKHPGYGRNTSTYMGKLSIDGKFVSTSGVYERGFESDGVWYHHLIDPQTGYPAENNLQSVTVVGDSGMTTDIYSTALFVMGEERGLAFAQENGIDALFLTEDGRALFTDGFKEKYHFEFTSSDYHEA